MRVEKLDPNYLVPEGSVLIRTSVGNHLTRLPRFLQGIEVALVFRVGTGVGSMLYPALIDEESSDDDRTTFAALVPQPGPDAPERTFFDLGFFVDPVFLIIC